MRLDEQTIKDYPKMHYYVRVNMPQVANVQAIVSQIHKIAGKVDKATIKNALKWGEGPTIKVVDNLMCAGAKSYGCYSFGSDVLRVDKALVEEFEAGKGLVKTAHGKLVYLLGVTILHELTHWADAQDGDNAAGEDGNAYERGVYGKVLDHSDAP
jgi:hypothetical protein